MASRTKRSLVPRMPDKVLAPGAYVQCDYGKRASSAGSKAPTLERVALGIDPSRRTGLGVVGGYSDGSACALAAWTAALDEDGPPARLVALALLDRPRSEEIDLVSIEAQYSGLNRLTGLVLSRLAGILEGLSWYLVSPERLYRLAPNTWRSRLGLPRGPRARAKAAAMRHCRLALGWETDDEDMADALCIAHAALLIERDQ